MLDRRGYIYKRLTSNIRIDPETGCWIWQGADSGTGRGGGYGRMSLDGRTVAVHRVMATHLYGYIPGNKHVDHKCRNRMCICPDHLEITTHRENCRRRDAAKETGVGI